MNIELFQEASSRASIRLDPHIGETLRCLIIQSTNKNFQRYVEDMGLQATNVANYLSGRNPITLLTLSKLLAGTNLSLQCTLQIVIGETAAGVDSIPAEEMLFLEELATSDKGSITTPTTHLPNIPTSSSLEKPPEVRKTTPDFPFKDRLVASSTLPLNTLLVPSDTILPTSSDADQPTTVSVDNLPQKNKTPVDPG
jgi:hypothetical protein